MTNPTLQATHTQPSRSRDQRALSRSTVLALVGIALLVAGPWIFDSYVLNLLIKAFLFAIVVITVDVLWGYTGYLTFGQSAFFGIGAYAAGLVFTHFGLSPATIAIAIGRGPEPEIFRQPVHAQRAFRAAIRGVFSV